MKRKYNEGFTLVELMVSIMVASIVTLAASTVLLMGFRLNRSASDTAQRQNTTRIFMTVVERMATEGTIDAVTDAPDHWKAIEKVTEGEAEQEKILFYYDAENGIIYSGGTAEGGVYSGGTVLMENVIASHVTLEGALLTVSLETQDGSYSTSVYCRTAVVEPEYEGPKVEDAEEALEEVRGKEARAKLLKILLSQRGSTGMIYSAMDGSILDANGEIVTLYKTPVYYAQWYEPDWPSDTPWCACFLSWGLDKVSTEENINPAFLSNIRKTRVIVADNSSYDKYFWFANVDEFMRFFKGEIQLNGTSYDKVSNPPLESPHWVSLKDVDLTLEENSRKIPYPGDIAFIDWTRTQTDPAHVGIVLAVKDGYIYTIEGNSANTVAVRKYALNDKLIMGYGIIDWLPDPVPTT